MRWWPTRERWIDIAYEITSGETGPILRGLPPKERRRQDEQVGTGTVWVTWYRGPRRKQRLDGELRIRPGRVSFREGQVNPVVFNCYRPRVRVGDVHRSWSTDLNGGWIGATRWLHLQCGETAVDLLVSDYQAERIAKAIAEASPD